MRHIDKGFALRPVAFFVPINILLIGTQLAGSRRFLILWCQLIEDTANLVHGLSPSELSLAVYRLNQQDLIDNYLSPLSAWRKEIYSSFCFRPVYFDCMTVQAGLMLEPQVPSLRHFAGLLLQRSD